MDMVHTQIRINVCFFSPSSNYTFERPLKEVEFVLGGQSVSVNPERLVILSLCCSRGSCRVLSCCDPASVKIQWRGGPGRSFTDSPQFGTLFFSPKLRSQRSIFRVRMEQAGSWEAVKEDALKQGCRRSFWGSAPAQW